MKPATTTASFHDWGYKAITTQLEQLQALPLLLGDAFSHCCELLEKCRGKVVVIGLGKSGLIGKKFAATLASTGTPAFFVHATEANHGDLGAIATNDVVVAFSFSGEGDEILRLIPAIKKRLSIPLIAMTGRKQSTLAMASDCHLWVAIEQEACPLGLAPTTSTTAMLLLSDAIAIALLRAKQLTNSDFAGSHPGGTLGKRLLLTMKDIMHTGNAIPRIPANAHLDEALVEITRKQLGMGVIVEDLNQDNVIGILTDGDLRRAFQQRVNPYEVSVKSLMTPHGIGIVCDKLACDGLELMKMNGITTLLVYDSTGSRLAGIAHIHDILRSGIV